MISPLAVIAREVLLRCARIVAALLGALLTGWRLLVVYGISILGVLILLAILMGVPLTTVVSLGNYLGLFVGLLALCWALQVQRRMVINEFVDATGDKSMPAGLAALLVHELDELRRLYQRLDDPRPLELQPLAADRGSPIGATVQIGSIGEALQTAVSADTKVSVGPVQVPLGSLVTLLARILRGPRISGTIQKDADGYLVIARLEGARDSPG